MKKCIAILVALSMAPLASSFAEEFNIFDKDLPDTVKASAQTDDALKLAALEALGEVPVTDQPKVIVEITDEIDAFTNQAEEEVAAAKQATQSKFSNLLYNDLREAAKFDKNLSGTSAQIIRRIESNPFTFTGVNVRYYSNKDGGLTPLGPLGAVQYKTNPLTDKQLDKKHFKIENHRANRRKNVIFSASYERIVKTSPDQHIYDIDLMLFLHSDQTGYVFRYINITADWAQRSNDLMKITMNKVLKEVPLSETNFEVRAELASQKVILRDRSKHGVIKVLPMTAGAIDSRAKKSTSLINSMTLLMPNTGKRIVYKDFEINESYLIKRSEWTANTNSPSRTEPSYYKGRPFMGIVDSSLLLKNDDGTIQLETSGKPNYDRGYRQIGFHYQIEDSGLERGFESHGCMRLQDHDLYTIDAIVNEGPNMKVPIEVKMVLNTFQNLDSVYRRSNNYKKVVYTDTTTPNHAKCKNKPSYEIRQFTDQNGTVYHTLADSDCLTKTSKINANLDHVVDVLTGKSADVISTLFIRDLEHTPVLQRLEFMKNNTYILNYKYPQNITLGVDQFAGKLNHADQITVIDEIKSCMKNHTCVNTAYSTSGNTYATRKRTWRRVRKPIFKKRRKKSYYLTYRDHCSGKTAFQATPGVNCSILLDKLKSKRFSFKK